MKKISFIAAVLSGILALISVAIEDIYGYCIWFPVFLLCLLHTVD
jgi:apolipoprotein N-acyltransferase